MATTNDIRAVILKVIQDQHPKGQSGAPLNQKTVLDETKLRLNISYENIEKEQAILTAWSDLFRTGYLAWGLKISSPDRPLFHVTEMGRSTLASLNSDPGNPAGYLHHLSAIAQLNPIVYSYLKESLESYVSGHYKAAVVMVGGATESIILELRDITVQKLTLLGKPVDNKLNDWRIKTVSNALHKLFDGLKTQMVKGKDNALRDEFEAYWSAFAQQIRAVRNDAGHPTSVDPVTQNSVRASLLIFIEIAKLADKLKILVNNDLK